MTAQIDPVEAQKRLKRVFELSAKVHEQIRADLRREHPNAANDELFELYCWKLAERRRGKHGLPWVLEVEWTKKFIEEWKRKR